MHTTRILVFEADVERSVGVRVKDGALLTSNVLGTTVLVADGVPDLHVDPLSIALETADGGSDDDEGVPADEIPDASQLRIGGEIELEGVDGCDEEDDAADVLQQSPWESHGCQGRSSRMSGSGRARVERVPSRGRRVRIEDVRIQEWDATLDCPPALGNVDNCLVLLPLALDSPAHNTC